MVFFFSANFTERNLPADPYLFLLQGQSQLGRDDLEMETWKRKKIRGPSLFLVSLKLFELLLKLEKKKTERGKANI